MSLMTNKSVNELFSAILDLNDLSEARCFFRDLLTEAEISEFANRFQVAKMLYKKRPYSEIELKTKMSTTTIARVSKWLNNGKNGYKLVLDRLNTDTHHRHSQLGNVS